MTRVINDPVVEAPPAVPLVCCSSMITSGTTEALSATVTLAPAGVTEIPVPAAMLNAPVNELSDETPDTPADAIAPTVVFLNALEAAESWIKTISPETGDAFDVS